MGMHSVIRHSQSDHHFHEESTLHLVLPPRRVMQIFVMMRTGKIFTLDPEASDTMHFVEAKTRTRKDCIRTNSG